MKTYSCSGFRNVRVEDNQDMRDAAEVFAGREARKAYGRSGYCRTLRLDGWSQDGTRATYEGFIGYSDGNGGTIGKNVWLTIDKQEAR